MRRSRPVLWGDRDMAALGAERLGRPVVFVGRMEGEGRGSGPGSVGRRGGFGRPPWGAIGGRRRSPGSFAGMGAFGVLGLGGRAWAGPERGLWGCGVMPNPWGPDGPSRGGFGTGRAGGIGRRSPWKGGGGALWGPSGVENRGDLRRRVCRPAGASRPSLPRVVGIPRPRSGEAGRAIPVCRSSSWGSRGGPSSGRLGLPSCPNSWPNLSCGEGSEGYGIGAIGQ